MDQTKREDIELVFNYLQIKYAKSEHSSKADNCIINEVSEMRDILHEMRYCWRKTGDDRCVAIERVDITKDSDLGE